MSQLAIEIRVAKVIADHFGGLKLEEIEPEMELKADLGADSLDAAELPMKLEEEFGVQISDDAAETCTTVRDVQHLLVKLQGDVA